MSIYQDPNDKDNNDLTDSKRDFKRMQQEEVTLDQSDVHDRPGQENTEPPKMSVFNDSTISSDDEEGRGLFEEEET